LDYQEFLFKFFATALNANIPSSALPSKINSLAKQMADFAIIGLVGEILKRLLRENLHNAFTDYFTTEDSVSLLSPKELEGTATNLVALFLYHVTENAYMKNQAAERLGPAQLRFPPLALNLYYLLTPFAGDGTTAIPGWDIHSILGRAMQVFYDNAILEGPALMDVLEKISQEIYFEQIENIRIILNSLPLDDLTKIWNSLDTPLRLSVCYEVRVVLIASERKIESQRILEKRTDYYQIKN